MRQRKRTIKRKRKNTRRKTNNGRWRRTSKKTRRVFTYKFKTMRGGLSPKEMAKKAAEDKRARQQEEKANKPVATAEAEAEAEAKANQKRIAEEAEANQKRIAEEAEANQKRIAEEAEAAKRIAEEAEAAKRKAKKENTKQRKIEAEAEKAETAKKAVEEEKEKQKRTAEEAKKAAEEAKKAAEEVKKTAKDGRRAAAAAAAAAAAVPVPDPEPVTATAFVETPNPYPTLTANGINVDGIKSFFTEKIANAGGPIAYVTQMVPSYTMLQDNKNHNIMSCTCFIIVGLLSYQFSRQTPISNYQIVLKGGKMLELYFSQFGDYISHMMRGLYSSNDIDIIVRKINSSGQDDDIQGIATEIRDLMVDIVSKYLDNPTTTIGIIEVNNVLKISSLKMLAGKKTFDPVIDINPVRHVVNDSLTQPYEEKIKLYNEMDITKNPWIPKSIITAETAITNLNSLDTKYPQEKKSLFNTENQIINRYNDPTTNMQQITLDIGTTDLVPMYVFYNLFPTTFEEKLFFYIKFLITGEEFLSDKFKRSILAILSFEFLRRSETSEYLPLFETFQDMVYTYIVGGLNVFGMVGFYDFVMDSLLNQKSDNLYSQYTKINSAYAQIKSL
jgi:hypothetical protein